jgi:hypothetical protein
VRTYDTGARSHGSRPTWKSLKGILRRWIDRERELISLRNAVGMMSEARGLDMEEYDAMSHALRQARDRIHILESHLAASRDAGPSADQEGA